LKPAYSIASIHIARQLTLHCTRIVTGIVLYVQITTQNKIQVTARLTESMQDGLSCFETCIL